MDLRNRRITVYRSPRMVAEFEMDRRGIARIAVGRELADATRAVVRDRAMPYAIRISPRGRRDEEHGGNPRYVESFRIRQGFTVIAGMRRVAAKLINIAPHAAAVEFTGSNPHASGYGVLRKTLAHLNGTGASLREAKTPWRPELHPRGPGGRFISKATAEQQRAERDHLERLAAERQLAGDGGEVEDYLTPSEQAELRRIFRVGPA